MDGKDTDFRALDLFKAILSPKNEALPSLTQLNDLALPHVFAVYYKAYEGAYFVPAMVARCTWVHVQAFDLIVEYYLQDM